MEMQSRSQLPQVSFVLKSRDRWQIIVDGAEWREVHRTIFGAKPRFPPLTAESDLHQIFEDYEYRRVKNYIIWRLTKQSYHSEQLAKLLRERLVPEKTILCALNELQTAGLLDDEAWLMAFLKSNQTRYGLPLILAKLRAKGLSSKTLQQLSQNEKDPNQELLAIQHLLQTRYRRKDLTDYKTRAKVYTTLMRKGFDYQHVKTAMQIMNS